MRILGGLLAALVVSGCAGEGTRSVSLVVTNGQVVTMDGSRRVLPSGGVAIDRDRIVAVESTEELARHFRAEQAIDAGGGIIMPGLINTHTHAPMVLYRGLADDLALMDWLQKYIFPAEAKTVSPAFVRTGTRLAALEMIQSGTTTFADMYYFESTIAEEVAQAGLRGVLGQTVIQFPVADARTPQEGLARAEAFIRQWNGHPLITPAVAPHALYTLDAATLQAARRLAVEQHVPMLIHLAETEAEAQTARERGAASAVAYLDGLGVLGRGVLGAHGVWVSPEEVAVLKARGVGIAHNPASNMKLASGVAPVPAYLSAGVALGLGTDGAASSNDLDMFMAMRLAALLHKVEQQDPRVVPATAVVEMATLGGARALGLEAVTGSLEPGKRADVIVVGVDGAAQTPLFDPLSHLVYVAHGGDVRHTVVNGRVLMKDRRVLTLNEPSVLADARLAAGAVRAAVAP
ncbi:MAG: amidohydrolase family protein [Vicinamibacterales bacterium]